MKKNCLFSVLFVLFLLGFGYFVGFFNIARGATESVSKIKQSCAGETGSCFTSLSAWEAAYGGINFGQCPAGDLVCADKTAVAQISGLWTNSDASPVAIDGWKTDSTHYIKIYTDSSARHSGKWDTNKYRIETSSSNSLQVLEDNVIIDGLQIGFNSNTDWQHGVYVSNNKSVLGEVKISNNLIKKNGGSGTWQAGIYIFGITGDKQVKIWNNIISNFPQGIYTYGDRDNAAVYAYNNTIHNASAVYGGGKGFYDQSGGRILVKNNIVQKSDKGYEGTFASGSDYNISDHADAPGANSKNSVKVSFLDSANSDFHLSSSDIAAKNTGINLMSDNFLSFTNDVDNNTRPVGSDWDIGADEESTVLPMDTMPPVISGGAPSGALLEDIAQTTVSVSTNENAVCKYSTNSGIDYASMQNTFSLTGGVSHSFSVSGLTNGNSYSYYIRCKDTAQNVNISDYVINFSIASLMDTTPPTVSISLPLSNASVSGIVNLTALASDNKALAGVQFKIDGINVGQEDLTSPYSYSLDTATLTNSSHTITVVARDASGNTAASSGVLINVNNIVIIGSGVAAPLNFQASAVSSTQINLSWQASVGAAGYKIYRNGVLLNTINTPSYQDSGVSAATSYTYSVTAYNSAGSESVKSNSVSATTLPASGNVYYVCDISSVCGSEWSTGSDLNSGLSKSSSLKTIKAGIAKLVPGDTLIIGDGVYKGIENMISSAVWAYDKMPSGLPGKYITIRGEHYLGAVLDAEGVGRPVHLEGNSYIIFENLYFKNSEIANGGANFRADKSNHIKVLNTGSEEGGNGHYWFRYSNHILVEDAFALGKGSYYFAFVGSFGIYTDSQYNICRRCVARLDYHQYLSGGNWFAPFASYWADNTYFQNGISIDGLPGNPLGDSAAVVKGFYTANGSSNYSAEGSIILNQGGNSATFESGSSNNILRNNVIWNNSTGVTQCCNTGGSLTFENNTVGSLYGGGFYDGFGIYNYKDSSGNITPVGIKNNIFYKNNQAAMLDTPSTNSYNSFYLNTMNYSGSAKPGIGEITANNPLNSGLKYLPRTEDSSFLKTAGSGGGQIGAQIVKKIGVSGTFYGDPGWNTETSENLWPFPHEDKIKEKMAAYALHGVSGARGFAAPGNGLYGGPKTLTSYIWEYLGNPCPIDICFASTNITPSPVPNVPIAVSATTSVSSSTADYLSVNPVLDLTNSVPEQGSMTVNILDDPMAASSASLLLTIFDPDNAGEGYISINGKGSIEVPNCGSSCDNQSVAFSPIMFDKNSLVKGINTIKFTHIATHGYEVSSAGIRLNFVSNSNPIQIPTLTTLSSASQIAPTTDTAATGGGTMVSPVNTQTILDTTSPAILNLTAVNIKTDSADIVWNTDEQADSIVEYGLTQNFGMSAFGGFTLSHSINLSGLSGNTLYYYRVRSKDSSGNEAVSIIKTFTTAPLLDTTAPSVISTFWVATPRTTSLDLAWLATGDDGNIGTAFSYDLRYLTSQINEANWQSAVQASGEPAPLPAGSKQFYTLVGLKPNTLYYVGIKAIDEAGNISPLKTLLFYTKKSRVVAASLNGMFASPLFTLKSPVTESAKDLTPPSKVFNLTAFAAKDQVLLTWKNPKDLDFVRVIVVRKEGGYPNSREDGAQIFEGDREEFTDMNLTVGKKYYYAIYAFDRDLNFSEPAQIFVETSSNNKEYYSSSKNSQSSAIKIEKGFFVRNLKTGMKGEDVRKLQEILFVNKEEFYPECKNAGARGCVKKDLVSGYFGARTSRALSKFQEKYKNEVLTPFKLYKGTGALGPATIKKLNELYGF